MINISFMTPISLPLQILINSIRVNMKPSLIKCGEVITLLYLIACLYNM
jgi:hypothetical protein